MLSIGLPFAFLLFSSPATGQDFEEDKRQLIMEYRNMTGDTQSLAAAMIVLDYVDNTGEGSPTIGGSTAGLGRYLRDVIACDMAASGIEIIAPNQIAEVMRKSEFLMEDVYKDAAILALMAQFPNAAGIVTGVITHSRNPALIDVETTLRVKINGELIPTVGLSSIVMDSNVSAAMGVNNPPLSDNRPNLVLAGHPFRDRDAPYRVEILGKSGVKRCRYKNSRVFVAGDPGESYAIRLTNNSANTVAAALFVDSRSVGAPPPSQMYQPIDKSYASPSEAEKIVIEPGCSMVIQGWRLNSGFTPFIFATATDSESLERNFWDSTGLISAIFYEAATDSRIIWDVSRDEEKWVLKRLPDPRAGSVESPVYGVGNVNSLVRHAESPGAVLNIHYDIARKVDNYSLVKE